MKFSCFIQTINWNVRYFNFFIQTSYLDNEGNLIASNSNTMHFNFLALLKCSIQTQGYNTGKLKFHYFSLHYHYTHKGQTKLTRSNVEPSWLGQKIEPSRSGLRPRSNWVIHCWWLSWLSSCQRTWWVRIFALIQCLILGISLNLYA